ncbi:MAG: Mov34/MPN/PAD-1 family protein, partial [Deltaproteobacteria bacterium]|nr:Mov34/MPN/PAD-1 family protein [Deltaproteobacteria bacterium]
MLIITRKAMEEIEKECGNHDRETGGILVGPEGMDIVTGFIASGHAAFRASYAYEQTPDDVAHLNHELRKRQAIGEEFQGYLHRHPGSFNRPSNLDLKTARNVLSDPSYNLFGRLWMGIVTFPNGKDDMLELDCYRVVLSEGEDVLSEHVAHEIIEQDDLGIREKHVATENLGSEGEGHITNAPVREVVA